MAARRQIHLLNNSERLLLTDVLVNGAQYPDFYMKKVETPNDVVDFRTRYPSWQWLELWAHFCDRSLDECLLVCNRWLLIGHSTNFDLKKELEIDEEDPRNKRYRELIILTGPHRAIYEDGTVEEVATFRRLRNTSYKGIDQPLPNFFVIDRKTKDVHVIYKSENNDSVKPDSRDRLFNVMDRLLIEATPTEDLPLLLGLTFGDPGLALLEKRLHG